MSEPKQHWNVVYVCSGALVGLAILIFGYLNRPNGPVMQVVGTVRSYAFIPNDGPPTKGVSVLLQSGVLVLARSPTQLVVNAGDSVRVDVYRKLLTGAETYTVVGLEPKR